MVINSSKMDFSEVVDKYITDYRDEVWENLYATMDEVSKEAVKKLKSESRSKFKNSGKHKKTYGNWRRKTEKGRIRHGVVIYGADGTYQLAHLLEYGHAKANGGRVDGVVHIEPVEEWAVGATIDRFIEKMNAF